MSRGSALLIFAGVIPPARILILNPISARTVDGHRHWLTEKTEELIQLLR